jgi:hypothetical protein
MRLIHSWQTRSGGIVHANGVVQTTGLWLLLCFWFCGACSKVEKVLLARLLAAAKKFRCKLQQQINEF